MLAQSREMIHLTSFQPSLPLHFGRTMPGEQIYFSVHFLPIYRYQPTDIVEKNSRLFLLPVQTAENYQLFQSLFYH